MDYRPIDENREKLIDLFTQKNQVVFDPYLHYGDTMMAALSVGRAFIGLGETKAQCDEIISRVDSHWKDGEATLFNQEDHPHPLDKLPNKSIDFILTEMPIFDFKDNEQHYEKHLLEIEQTIRRYRKKLKPKAYLALMVSDQRYQGRYYCRHADMIAIVEKTGFILQGLINLIQDSQALKAYGYPSTYVPNIINQFVVIARL